jgi:hypothetical protein
MKAVYLQESHANSFANPVAPIMAYGGTTVRVDIIITQTCRFCPISGYFHYYGRLIDVLKRVIMHVKR